MYARNHPLEGEVEWKSVRRRSATFLVLILKSNNFHGNIQPSFAVKSPFPGLQVLDLSHNGFVGQLPTKYFQNFNSMKNVVKDNTEPQYLYMGRGKYYSFVVAMKGMDRDVPRLFVGLTIIDLSNNYFESGIPEIIGNLSALKVLNLSHNSLNGRIPDSLGKLSEIESLDLSSNQLTGNIPQSLAGINGLEGRSIITKPSRRTVFRKEHTSHTCDESFICREFGTCGGERWGYGFGTLLGLRIGNHMVSRESKWFFNLIADAGERLILERNKRRYVFIGK
ncbi:leucine-rich repeat-containing protein [Tanacetum coccineum]